jgi:serine/threonine protein kinase
MCQVYNINMGPMGYVRDKECNLSVLRGQNLIAVTVTYALIDRTKFGEELLQQVKEWKASGGKLLEQKPVIDLVYQHSLPMLEQLASHTSLSNLSIESFLRQPTFNIEIVKGEHDNTRFEGVTKCTYKPAFFTTPVRTAELPEACGTVPHISASDVYVAPCLRNDEGIDTIQGRVVLADGSAFYFKPRMDMREPDFKRELQILLQLRDLRNDNTNITSRLKAPILEGLVVSGDDTVGLLMTLIDGTHLRSPEHVVRHKLHQQWETQLRDTVQELHAHDIVWGDVHPMNVIIDEESNAWAIDFGGMNNVEFIDDDKRETIEGDWQGLRSIFEKWLPSQRQAEKKTRIGQGE